MAAPRICVLAAVVIVDGSGRSKVQMKLEATVMQLIEDGGELSVTIHGWAESDPAGCRRARLERSTSRPTSTIVRLPTSAAN